MGHNASTEFQKQIKSQLRLHTQLAFDFDDLAGLFIVLNKEQTDYTDNDTRHEQEQGYSLRATLICIEYADAHTE